MRSWISAIILMLLLPACGGGGSGGDPEYFIQGTVTIDDGVPFDFLESCKTSDMEISGDLYQGMEAEDLGRPLGLVINWRRDFVTGPGTFDASAGLTDLSTSIVRAHPTDPGKVRISTVGAGSVIFEQVGYEAGDILSGRLEDILMERDDPDDTIRITFDDGTFHCLVR